MLPVGRVCKFCSVAFQRVTPLADGGVVAEAPSPVLINAALFVCTLASNCTTLEMLLLSPPPTDIDHQPVGGLFVTEARLEKSFV